MTKDTKKQIKSIVAKYHFYDVLDKITMLEDFCILSDNKAYRSYYISIAQILDRCKTDIQLEQTIQNLTTGKYSLAEFVQKHPLGAVA